MVRDAAARGQVHIENAHDDGSQLATQRLLADSTQQLGRVRAGARWPVDQHETVIFRHVINREELKVRPRPPGQVCDLSARRRVQEDSARALRCQPCLVLVWRGGV